MNREPAEGNRNLTFFWGSPPKNVGVPPPQKKKKTHTQRTRHPNNGVLNHFSLPSFDAMQDQAFKHLRRTNGPQLRQEKADRIL